MITGGNASVFVTNMDAALKFYTEVLGLTVSSHYGDNWATVEAGAFTIGLHPKSDKNEAPGTKGSIIIGLTIDESIEAAAANASVSTLGAEAISLVVAFTPYIVISNDLTRHESSRHYFPP